ncbi:MAG: hypothetical protein CVT80_12015 [Alphaproteobacteria bacterium HGW-Alphaproteobacteria-2]|nr:MAG: hypothetical protein CVT80_12015 [Alphaproteobacteria bacterium HGW-Alphaproteobacteria-2]
MSFNRSALLLASAGVLALSACVDPNNPQSERNRTAEGAVIGGVLGAMTGVVSGGNRGTRAVVGGLAGAAAGAAIGNSLDRQAQELAATLDSRVSIVNTGSELIVTMPQDILFAVDSAFVQPALQDDLRALSDSLRRYPQSNVLVIGHTDSTGSAAHNQDLSQRRAASVSSILIGAGTEPYRVRAIGRGEDEPVATNLTPEGRAQNRRVEIVIRPTA